MQKKKTEAEKPFVYFLMPDNTENVAVDQNCSISVQPTDASKDENDAEP